jgi:hypothetical protein
LQEYFVEDKNTGKYVCNKCNKKFFRLMKLVQHIERHHGNYGNYLCGLCQNQLVLDIFVVFAMLYLMFQEILKITWPPMTQSEYFCSP